MTIGKLGGRGLPLETRLRWLHFLRLAEREKNTHDVHTAYREHFGHACCCYYPDTEAGQKIVVARTETAVRHNFEAAPKVLGHNSCPRAIGEILDTLPFLTDDQPASLRLVIPPLTPGMFADFEVLLKQISQREETEIVLNDYGALRCAAARKRSGALKAKLTLGVLLAGQETDPVLAELTQFQESSVFWEPEGCAELRWSPPPEKLQAHWRCPSVVHQDEMFRSLGVTGIELGLQALEPVPELPGLSVRRLDFAVVSVIPCGRDCAHCGGRIIKRAGKHLFWDRNLLLWSE